MNQMVGTLELGLTRDWSNAGTRTTDDAFRQLRDEYQAQQALFDAQPPDTRRFLLAQAIALAEALVQGRRQIELNLPDQVLESSARLLTVPADFRQQAVGGLLDRVKAQDNRALVRRRLAQLEQSSHPAVAVCAKLIRYATVNALVHDTLATGQPFTYVTAEGAAVLTNQPSPDAARRFYLPEWLAFDDDRLLVDSLAQAEARIAEMQRYVSTLHLAVSLAPYIYADEEYQRKRVGMLGQLLNQGRALARYQTHAVIHRLERKAAAHELDRGLSLSLPYFDDQMLEIKVWTFEVIPGRTLFVPAFVVLAARREQERAAQDKRLSHSTRMYLVSQLKTLERAFESSEM